MQHLSHRLLLSQESVPQKVAGKSLLVSVQALLRRLEKRIYVSLPDLAARTHMFTRLLQDRGLSNEQLSYMGQQTEGYSGSDIASLCKEVAMRSVQLLHVGLVLSA